MSRSVWTSTVLNSCGYFLLTNTGLPGKADLEGEKKSVSILKSSLILSPWREPTLSLNRLTDYLV